MERKKPNREMVKTVFCPKCNHEFLRGVLEGDMEAEGWAWANEVWHWDARRNRLTLLCL